MNFELTSEVKDEIIYAMENQGKIFVFDAVEGIVLPESEVCSPDDQRFYKLPVWDSACGFRLMEHFVASLRNPPVREELRGILKSGHGVFRNFKDVLKANPNVEQLWFSFKEHEMNQVILNWYDELRELWGLEHLELEPEENDELVHDDFLFRSVSAGKEHSELICKEELFKEFNDFYETDLGNVLLNQWKKINDSSVYDLQTVVCETVSGEPAGFAAAFKDKTDATVAMISALYIVPRFRGLGLSKELLEFLLAQLKDGTTEKVAVSRSLLPDFFNNVLERAGFSQFGSVFLLKVPLMH